MIRPLLRSQDFNVVRQPGHSVLMRGKDLWQTFRPKWHGEHNALLEPHAATLARRAV